MNNELDKNNDIKTDLKENAKIYIANNWDIINNYITDMINKKISIIKIEDLKIDSNYYITITIEDSKVNLITLNKNDKDDLSYFLIEKIFRRIKFIFEKNGKKYEKTNIIFNSDEIINYIYDYDIKNPNYLLNNRLFSINYSNINEIFNNLYIEEIYDVKIDIPDTYFIKNYYIKKLGNKVLNLYIDDNMNKYCSNIYNGKYEITTKRKKINNEINNFIQSEDPFLFITGTAFCGKSVTILEKLEESNKKFLYLDFKYIYDLQDDNSKRQYIIKECMRLFDNYYNYKQFIITNHNIFLHMNNVLFLIKLLIQIIIEKFKNNALIIIDNYDDIYVDRKLDYIYIENLLKHNDKAKIIFCGNGNFFNYLIIHYFSGKNNKYKFLYIDNLNLDLSNDNNDYINYLNKKYNNNKSKIIFYLLLFKRAINPINISFIIDTFYLKYAEAASYSLEKYNGFINFENMDEFPSQFFEFKKIDKVVTINFYKTNYENFVDNDVKIFLIKDIIFFDLTLFNNSAFKGIVEEELIITLIEMGKIILTKEIDKNNIIKVKEILSIKEENKDNYNKINLEDPIIIRQTNSSAEALDLCIIINNTALLIQIGINKNRNSIIKVINKKYNSLINYISNYINKKIYNFQLLFIFDKNKIETLYEEFNAKLNAKKILQEKLNIVNIRKITNEIKSNIDYQNYKKLKNEISKFSYKLGPEVCKIKKIQYLLFSLNNFKLYQHGGGIINDTNQFFNILNLNKNSKIPKNIIVQLRNYEDFQNLIEIKYLSQVESQLNQCTIEKKFCFLNCDNADYQNFNIIYFLKNICYKISFIDGIISDDNKEDYSYYYLLSIRSARFGKLFLKRKKNKQI